MKASVLVPLCVLLAALAGGGTAYVINESRHDDASIRATGDDAAALERCRERLAALEETMSRVERRLASSPGIDLDALEALETRQARVIEELRGEIARLGKGPARSAAADELLAAVGGGEEVDRVLGAYVEKAIARQAAERRKMERKRWTPFVRAQMERQLQRSMKRLKLNPEQTKRFEETVRASFEKVEPALGIIMDPAAKPTEKEAAFVEIEGARSEVDSEVQSFMDAEQYDVFLEEQSKQMKQMDQMRKMFGGGAKKPGAPSSAGE